MSTLTKILLVGIVLLGILIGVLFFSTQSDTTPVPTLPPVIYVPQEPVDQVAGQQQIRSQFPDPLSPATEEYVSEHINPAVFLQSECQQYLGVNKLTFALQPKLDDSGFNSEIPGQQYLEAEYNTIAPNIINALTEGNIRAAEVTAFDFELYDRQQIIYRGLTLHNGEELELFHTWIGNTATFSLEFSCLEFHLQQFYH